MCVCVCLHVLVPLRMTFLRVMDSWNKYHFTCVLLCSPDHVDEMGHRCKDY